jgi:Inositol monophosphatase family
VVATALPFRFPAELDAAAAVFLSVQKICDDQRRGGSAALDLAYTAVGRLDGYYELGIYPWDTAAGELLVRGGGGVVTDWHGETGGILTRRSIVAGASAQVHAELLAGLYKQGVGSRRLKAPFIPSSSHEAQKPISPPLFHLPSQPTDNVSPSQTWGRRIGA